MTREEAIRIIKEELCHIRCENDYNMDECKANCEFKEAVEVLEQEPKLLQALEQEKGAYNALVKNIQCADCISRQALIEEFADMREGYPIMTDEQLTAEDVIKTILSMPMVQPKTGEWILQPSNKEQGERDFIWWKCSECGQVIFSETEKDRREFHAFCSRCGAKMT